MCSEELSLKLNFKSISLPRVYFAKLRNKTKHVYYLIKQEEVLLHQRQKFYPILAGYSTDKF